MNIADWIGRTESASDIVTAAPIAALSATLDRDDPPPRPGDPLPLLWHWLYFLQASRQSRLGEDGHSQLGGFLPPVALPRRMYAGGRVQVRHALRVGDPIERVSRIADVNQKDGRSGPLVFVQVRHEISNRDGLAIIEDQDIVYRDNPGTRDGQAQGARSEVPAPARGERVQAAAPLVRLPADDEREVRVAALEREMRADEVLLFRYSALTFNGYRLHYDRRFATETQGYPGLVVHAPLLATLLADLLRRHAPDAAVSDFTFRAVRPLFDTTPFFLRGQPAADRRTARLWASDATGATAFEANMTIEVPS